MACDAEVKTAGRACDGCPSSADRLRFPTLSQKLEAPQHPERHRRQRGTVGSGGGMSRQKGVGSGPSKR